MEKETLEESLPSLFFSHTLISISLPTFCLSGRPTYQHPLQNYMTASKKDKMARIRSATFLRTWCLRGDPTTEPPKSARARDKQLWWGRIPLEDIDKYILIRDVGLEASGKLDKITINLTVNLEIPHHQGAGGEDDFADKETFQKQLKKKRKEEHKKIVKETKRQKNTRNKNK